MSRTLILGPLLMLCVTAGCDKISDVLPDSVKDKAKEVQSSVQETVEDTASQAVEAVKEVAQTAGSAELKLGSEIQLGRCYASLHQPGEGRPAILELKSYRTEADETYPTFLFHAEAPSASWTELPGEQLSGQLFVQLQEDKPVWFTPQDQPVQVKILSNQDGKIEAELVSGLLNSSAGETLPGVSGKFHAVLP